MIYLAVRLPTFLALAERRGQFDPVGLLWWLTAPLPTALVVVWTIGTLLVGVAFTVGLATRVSGPAFAVGMLLATTYRSSWGQILWLENLMVLQLLIVAFSPSARRLGDRPTRSRAGRPSRAPPTAGPSASPRWSPSRPTCSPA